MDLTERQKNIFKTLVEEFTRTAEPVGSKTLLPLLDVAVSSATIRNELATLEKYGIVEKTHASSGRVPSNRGYRYYVENLLETRLDPQTEQCLRTLFGQRHGSLEELMDTCCSILSDMTHLTSVVIGPEQGKQKLLRVELIPISDRQAVSIFITDSGHTEHRIFNFEQNVSVNDLTACTQLLNSQLSGTPISEVPESLKRIEPLMAARLSRHEVLFEAFFTAFAGLYSNDSTVYGRANMLAQPEFADPGRLKELMQILENTSLIHAWTGSPENVSTRIDGRSELIQIGDCSVVSAAFETAPGEKGQLMVIGPNRMPYARVIALMECMSSQIETLFARSKQGGLKNEQEIQSESNEDRSAEHRPGRKAGSS